MVFLSSDFTVPSSVSCSRSDLFHANESNFLINAQAPAGGPTRVKRAPAATKLSVARPLGTLVNSARGGQSGAPISLNVGNFCASLLA